MIAAINSSQLFWVTSRAAGTTAMVLSSAAVAVGLSMGGKLFKRAGNAGDRRSLHEVLSLSVMVAIAIHGLSLLGDTWLHSTVADITIPFAASYDKLPTALGIIAGWGLIILGLSYYLRRRIGQQRWRLIHRFTALAWLMALVHTFTEGSDAGRPWFIALILGTAAPGLVLLAVRMRRGRGASPAQPQPQPQPDRQRLPRPAAV